MRGTVSTLCANTSGRDSKTSLSGSGSPLKSGISSSTPVFGLSSLICAHGLGVQPRAAVGQVVAGDAGDGGIAQTHRLHALGDPARLVAVQFGGLAGVDLAEVAPAGALVAADQEGGFAVLPAFEDVGAAGFLADRVQALAPDQALQLGVLRSHPGAGLDPRRLALDRGLRRCAPRGAAICGLPERWSRPSMLRGQRRATDRQRPSRASHTASATGPATSSTLTVRPSSADNDVTPASLMPHGTIALNAPRSQSQLSANPCSVVARATRTPMAATLRAGRPRRRHPHPGPAFDPAGVQAQLPCTP